MSTKRNAFLVTFLAICLIAASSSICGPLSIDLDADGAETTARLSMGVFEWAQDPISATACSGVCCVNGTDAECLGLAKEIRSGGANTAAESIIPCIAKSVNFACEWWLSKGRPVMVCETFPETASVVSADVAACASRLAATTF